MGQEVVKLKQWQKDQHKKEEMDEWKKEKEEQKREKERVLRELARDRQENDMLWLGIWMLVNRLHGHLAPFIICSSVSFVGQCLLSFVQVEIVRLQFVLFVSDKIIAILNETGTSFTQKDDFLIIHHLDERFWNQNG